MLNKENRLILKELSGDYAKFSKKLAREVFSRCEGNRAINETLGEMFFTFKEAQEDNRSFEEVIPDPETTIKDTVLLFPLKKLARPALIGILSSITAVMIAAGLFALFYKPVPPAPPIAQKPVTLDPVQTAYFDFSNNSLFWENVPSATGYELYIDGEKIGTTTDSYLSLGSKTFLADELDVTVIAKGDSTHLDSSHHAKHGEVAVKTNYPRYEIQYPYNFVHDERFYTNVGVTVVDDIAFYPLIKLDGYSIDKSRVVVCTLTSEYNFYGLFSSGGILAVTDEENTEYDYTRPMFFRAGRKYVIYCSKPEKSGMDLYVKVASFLDFPDNILLPSGKTIFASVPYNDEEVLSGGGASNKNMPNSVYRAAGADSPIKFARYDHGVHEPSLGYDSVVYPGYQYESLTYDKSFIPDQYENLRYIIADNTSEKDAALILEPIVTEISNKESGTITVPKGLFAIRTLAYKEENIKEPAPGREFPPMLNLEFSVQLPTQYGRVFSYFLTDDWLGSGITGSGFSFFVCEWSDKADLTFIFYTDRETVIEYSCFLEEDNTIVIEEDGSYQATGLCVLDLRGNFALQGEYDGFFMDMNAMGSAYTTNIQSRFNFQNNYRFVTEFTSNSVGRKVFCYNLSGSEIIAKRL